ncbi:hypothetical protein J4Q44_G00071350 [Coregonus suidteri]|uniref:Uncharacterized protein n=1 Tax=Coregonus suidteri TaxID=861788 RepID=A0AAN8M5Q4_9TELE
MTSSDAEKWHAALNSIIEHLNDSDYKTMLNCLKEIPESVQKSTAREDMARIIIKHHGLDESILEVKRVMEEIPRKDPTVQNLLLPFVDDRNRKMQKENKGQKRKYVRESEDEESDAGQKKKGQGKSNKGYPPPSSKRTLKPWMITIAELKTLGELCDKVILGKMITV